MDIRIWRNWEKRDREEEEGEREERAIYYCLDLSYVVSLPKAESGTQLEGCWVYFTLYSLGFQLQ